jgi:hypothetical protein
MSNTACSVNRICHSNIFSVYYIHWIIQQERKRGFLVMKMGTAFAMPKHNYTLERSIKNASIVERLWTNELNITF